MFKIKYNYVMFQLNIHYSTLKINKYFHLQHLQLSEDIIDYSNLTILSESSVSYGSNKYFLEELNAIHCTNERFNNELQLQIEGKLPIGHIYKLGMPGMLLRASGFPNLPIELSSVRLLKKSMQENHIFDIIELRDLVKELNNPWAIFRYNDFSKNVIIGISHDDKQFLVGISLNYQKEGIEVSDIRSIFPKTTAKWLNWISQGKADYLDKEKIQTLIIQQRTNFAEVNYLDLNSIANIIENFENPKDISFYSVK